MGALHVLVEGVGVELLGVLAHARCTVPGSWFFPYQPRDGLLAWKSNYKESS